MMDLHCHLDLYTNPLEVARTAERRGLYVLAVGTTPKSFLWAKAELNGFSRVRPALGFHPEVIRERESEWNLFLQLLPEAKYVGEIGLDFSEHLKDSSDLQLQMFYQILDACDDAGGKVISIHSRRAVAGVLDGLRKYPSAGTFILHWFTGSVQELKEAVSLGCYFSVGPAMLSANKGKSLLAHIPRDRILLETDGPLGKVKGKFLYPWDADLAVKDICSQWATSEQDTLGKLRSNLNALLTSNVKRQGLGSLDC